MRLIKLKLKNIASLKGEHLIEFDAITKATSLFAITGETGSGKSSILNAIAMALYGKVYKTSVTQADIVTLGEREGHIQLIFSLKNEYYLADWRGRIRKPNGELLRQPKLERVIHKIETPDFEGKKSTDTYVADDLLNLNFDQFCKCIILNQGEFAKFLTSSFTDRKAILEKLYPGSEIENLSKILKLEVDQATSKINMISTQLETLHVSPEEGEILKLKKNELNSKVLIKTRWHKRYSSLSKLFEELRIYFSAYQENKDRKERLSNEIKSITQEFNHSLIELEKKSKILEEINLLSEKRTPLLQELIKKEEQLKLIKEQTSSFEEKLETLHKQKAQAKLQLEETESQKTKWHSLYQETLKKFNFSPELLLTHKNTLEAFVDNLEKLEKIKIEKNVLQDKINEVEQKGKDLKSSITELEELMPKDPQFLKDQISKLKLQRGTVQEQLNQKQVQEKTKEQTHAKAQDIQNELNEIEQQVKKVQEEQKANTPLLQSLEVSLSLYEYQLNLKNCIEHAKDQKLEECPICESKLEKDFWNKLNIKFSQESIEDIASKHQEVTTLNTDLKNKEIFLLSQKEKLKQELKKLQDEVLKLEQEIQKEIPDLKKLEEEIEKAEKEFINLEHQTKELTRLNNEIKQVRTQYVQIKEALSKLENETGPIEKENLSFKKITEMIHSELEVHVAELKSDLRSLVQLTHEKKQGEALEQKLTHIKESIKNSQTSIEEFSLKVENNNKKIQEIQTELQAKLEGKSAQEELNSLQTRIKTASGEFQNAQQVHKTHEQSLSLKRGNLSSLEQLLKDYELKFIETLMEIRNLGQEEEAPIQENIQNFEEKLKGISLTLNDSIEVILASKEFIQDILNDLDSKLTELSNELGVIKEKISHWEKTQDKIKLLRIEYEEAKSKVERFKRLSTILGTDELRTFALSLVEENLILQTNEELSHLCDSRYEIIHQSRRGITPEFYILDKFRGGETRKVSTLSGGETFMVSLAMALALAEMTRGQAEIDTLFIDEGFGTLDQESLEDVLEMLNQIQNRGLMIGIISHIKTLTQALAVNLVLTKAQDGTSKLSIQYN